MINSPIPKNIIEPSCSTIGSFAQSTLSSLPHHHFQQHQQLLLLQQKQEQRFILATSASAASQEKFVLPLPGDKSHSSSSPFSSKNSSSSRSGGNNSSRFCSVDGPLLCSDQKGFLDHLKPWSLFMSVSVSFHLFLFSICTSLEVYIGNSDSLYLSLTHTHLCIYII
jgi:hypothetical protein